MKLNKNGWGLVEFFMFLVIFIICLVISAVGFRKLGLVDENWRFVDDFSFTRKPKPQTNYLTLEEDTVNATKKYINDFYNNQLGLDTLNIKVSQLIDNKYMKEFKDADGKDCSGYVSVYLDDDNNIIYKPYIKCKKYETKGYEERKDS